MRRWRGVVSDLRDPIDPSRCPLCGGPNGCRLAAHPGEGGRCWCFAARFPERLLARVPERARNRACICQKCLEAALAEEAAGSS
jgi:hypothetical protein